ncbi:hypothetical protein GCK72_020136 [Caenorhabditis remanei]|uniref:Uncharacterized protein n=1 Tax=Caenorhabditis remanei TaxID=31234 RepID=A0A6A5GGN2_CAERE|nr:hypothetical protein GCK72_020136 [Caenorhabditis remanei]KAF1753579.1 hypothetical protein GCK72_020136 [Caenorhabditis remanei]
MSTICNKIDSRESSPTPVFTPEKCPIQENETPATREEKITELDELIRSMYLSSKLHIDIFPPAPEPGQIVIPTGGLARCICTPYCTKELPQPAYRILGESEEDNRWNLEKKTEEEILQDAEDIIYKTYMDVLAEKTRKSKKKTARQLYNELNS